MFVTNHILFCSSSRKVKWYYKLLALMYALVERLSELLMYWCPRIRLSKNCHIKCCYFDILYKCRFKQLCKLWILLYILSDFSTQFLNFIVLLFPANFIKKVKTWAYFPVFHSTTWKYTVKPIVQHFPLKCLL